MEKEAIRHGLQLTFEAYGNEVLTEKEHYDSQRASLSKLLTDKLIDQTNFNKISAELEKEHQASLSAIIKKYKENDEAAVAQATTDFENLRIAGMQEGAKKQIAVLTQ